MKWRPANNEKFLLTYHTKSSYFLRLDNKVNSLLLALDEVNGSLDSGNSVNLIITDLNVELFLKTHDKLNGIQRVSTQVIHEASRVFEVAFGVEVVHDKLTNFLLNRFIESGGRTDGHVVNRGEGGGRGHNGGEDKGLGLK